MRFAFAQLSFFRFVILISILLFFIDASVAKAKPLPAMSKIVAAKCGSSVFDVYTPPEKGSFPVVVSLSDSVEDSAAKAKSPSKKSKKNSRKKPRRGTTKESLQAMERFFVVQGYITINFRNPKLFSGPLTEPLVASVLKDINCAIEKSEPHGANRTQVFLLAKQKLGVVAINAASAESRVSVLPGLLGLVLIEPESNALVGKSLPANLPHTLLVDVADSEEEIKSLAFGKSLIAAGFPLTFVPARKKKKGDLASELGMASDVVTRDMIDFIRQRIKAQEEANQTKLPAKE